MRRWLLTLAIVLGMLSGGVLPVTPASAAGSTFYVNDATGNDANDCRAGTPCKTIQRGINAASAGDTVSVAAGDYSGGLSVNKANLTVQGEAGTRPNVILPADIVDGTGNVVVTANGVAIDHLRVQKTDTAADTALFKIPCQGGFPCSPTLYEDFTLNDVVGDGGRRGAFLSVKNVSVTNSTFLNQARDSLFMQTTQGAALISGNSFAGDPAASKKAVVYEPSNGTEPPTTGTITVTNNTTSGKNNFFVYNQWTVPAGSPEVSIDVSGNRLQGLGSSAIVAYDPAGTADHSHISSFDAHYNLIYPIAATKFAITSEMPVLGGVPIAAENNWFGCNAGPADAACSQVNPPVASGVDADPWLVLGLSAAPASVPTDGTSALSADLTHNSDGAVPAGGTVLDGTSIAFATDIGSVTTPGTTVNGVATSTFTAPGTTGTAHPSATLDAGSATASVSVVAADPPPTATSVSPAVGPTAGGNTVTITGTNLTGATAVQFGGVAATSYTIDSPTTITALVPANPLGVVDVQVTTPGGSSTLASGYRYGTAPTITSADRTSGTAGQPMAPFTVTTTGSPNPAVTKSGALPAGVTFTDNGDGTATLAGTPTETGTFPITITAANGVTPAATQNFTLTINKAPTITSADHTSGTAGQAMTPFTVTTTGSPNPAVTKTGALPAGVTFTDNGDGTATLAGTPTETGTFPLTITAANGVAPHATQNFTLTVAAQPVDPVATTTTLTSGSNPSIAGNPVTFGVSVSPAGASGTVTLSNGSTSVGSCTLSSGSCSVSTAALQAGSHSMTAVYEGDTTHTTSTSAVLTQAVAVQPSATQTPGHGVLIVDGVEIPVTVEVTDNRSALIVSGPGVNMTVGAVDANGNRVPLSVTNNVVIARGGMIRMQGTGFAPGSIVTLVLFSEPRDLAQVMVNSKGAFSADVTIPDDVAAGTHTVQSVGQTASGSPMAMSLALTIVKANKVVAQRPVKALKLPKRVANKGWTRMLRVPVRTNADQKASVSVTCVRRHRNNEISTHHSDACRVKRHAGVVRVWVSGDHGMKVRTLLKAPRTTKGVTTYRAYRKAKIYRTHPVPWLPTRPGTG